MPGQQIVGMVFNCKPRTKRENFRLMFLKTYNVDIRDDVWLPWTSTQPYKIYALVYIIASHLTSWFTSFALVYLLLSLFRTSRQPDDTAVEATAHISVTCIMLCLIYALSLISTVAFALNWALDKLFHDQPCLIPLHRLFWIGCHALGHRGVFWWRSINARGCYLSALSFAVSGSIIQFF